MLHMPSTAIYLSVLEGQADLYGCFLTAFLRLALSRLSAPPQSAAEYPPGLFVFDKAGSIQIRGLTNILSLAPASEVAIVVAFQDIGQVYDHYGLHDGDAVLRSFKTMVFLPGLDQRTTQFAARLADFNAIQHGVIDERRMKSKGDRLAETKRVEMYEEVLHELRRHKRAIALVGDAPPIKFLRAPLIQACPEELSRAANKGTPYIIDFRTAEAQSKGVKVKTEYRSASTERDISADAALTQSQTSSNNEIEQDLGHHSSKTHADDQKPLEV